MEDRYGRSWRRALSAGLRPAPLEPGASETPPPRLSLGALIGFRLVIVAVLLFVAGYVEAFQEVGLREPVFWLISATFTLTVLYAVMLGRASYEVQAVLQIVGDILVITGFVYLTGPKQGGFVALYPIVVLCGTVALGRGYAFAGFATLLYSSTLLLVRTGVVPPEGLADLALGPLRPIINSILILAVVCGSVAGLGMYLARALERIGAQLDRTSGELSDLEDLNRVIVESIQGGIVLADAQLRPVFANRVGAEFLAADPPGNEASGFARFVSLVSEARRDSSGGETAREVQFQAADGTRRTLGLTISPLSSPSLAGGSLLMFRDLTDIRELEEQARTNERLATVGGAAAQLAHEIRNPLGAITTAARLLADEKTSEQDRGNLISIIRTESDRLNRTLTRTLAGLHEGPPVPASVALENAVQDFVKVLRLSPEKSAGHSIVVDVSPGRHEAAISSEEVKQVLWNLAKNALEAMPDGGTLSLSLFGEGDSCVIEVSDEGPGMDPRRLGRLFEPLQTTKALGTGLGLAIAHRIVRRRGGDLSIRSQPGKGTTVRLAVPRHVAAAVVA